VSGKNKWHWLSVSGRVIDIRPDDNLAFIDRMARKYTGAEYQRRSPREIFTVDIDRPSTSSDIDPLGSVQLSGMRLGNRVQVEYRVPRPVTMAGERQAGDHYLELGAASARYVPARATESLFISLRQAKGADPPWFDAKHLVIEHKNSSFTPRAHVRLGAAPFNARSIVSRSEPCHRFVTHSRNREDTEGHQRTRRLVKVSTRGHSRKRGDAGGHDIQPVRDREAPGFERRQRLAVTSSSASCGQWPCR